MFVPITSEITLNTGMVLMEIATDRLFRIGQRIMKKAEVSGDETWELTEITPLPTSSVIQLPWQELSMKYLAEVDDEA